MIKIDTGAQEPSWGSMAGPIDQDRISYVGRFEHAERKTRQICAEIECCESEIAVDGILDERDTIITAIGGAYPELGDKIRETAEDHKAILCHGGAE